MIDIHCHILPEVDDGPKSWDVAEAMCRMAYADGIEHIIATPHANDRYHYDREYLTGLLDQLRQRVGRTPRLGLGCDFHLSFENLQDVFLRPERYCIEGTRYLLVELSNYAIPPQLEETFERLAEIQITPILTHPERNPMLQQMPDRVLSWAEQGCVVQVTGSALTGAWGDRAQQIAKWLLARKAVHVLATDAHETKRRVPILSTARDAVANLASKDTAQALVDSNPRAIVEGRPLPYYPPIDR